MLVDQTVNGVQTRVPTVFNDSLAVTIRNVPKNPSAVATDLNSITLTRYRVVFRRADGLVCRLYDEDEAVRMATA